jgi:hypothetical protein
MKVQLNTITKTIKIQETGTLGNLFDLLESILPNGLWREFTLDTASITEWYHPYPLNLKTQPLVYWKQPWFKSEGSHTIPTLDHIVSGVYNLIG